MIRPVVRDVLFLRKKAVSASEKDLSTAVDLLDTLHAHQRECVGMAANMIGFNKAIIAVHVFGIDVVMLNPVITKKETPYEAEEGCLSLSGTRKTTRYNRITVSYQDLNMKKHTQAFEGFDAEIIQHECDHLKGILI